MDKVKIRSTELEVNPVGLGTNAVGGQMFYPNITDDAGREILQTALDHGVDFWDTAFIYGPKRSEEIIGEVLHQTGRRNEIVLATKAGHEFVGDNVVMNNRPEFLEKAVEEAMQRLQTDFIDLFYIHSPDESTPKYEAVGALQRLKEKGLIRAIGVSNFSLEQLKEANQDGYVNVYQGHYNLLERQVEENIFPYTNEHNISFVPYFPFASGLLAGKYTKETTFTEGDLRLNKPEFQGDNFTRNLEKVNELQKMADAKGVDVAQIVLSWYLHCDEIDVVIPGAKKGSQLIDNLKTNDVLLSEEEFHQIDNLFL